MDDCPRRWPLLDPNPEDVLTGAHHCCAIPHLTGDHVHVCKCGDIAVEVEGRLHRGCDGCGDLVPIDVDRCDTCRSLGFGALLQPPV